MTLDEELAQAVVGESLEATREALRKGASPDARFEGGNHVLLLAANYALVDIFVALLAAGADPELTSNGASARTVLEHQIESEYGNEWDNFAEITANRRKILSLLGNVS